MAGDEDPEVCEVTYVDEERVKAVSRRMRTDDILGRLAETFSSIGDVTRVKIVMALSMAELCVCDLAALLKITSPAVSHHLRILRALRLVKARRQGRMVYYSLNDAHIEGLFRMGIEHVEEG